MEKREKGRARRWLIRLCSAALVALMVLPVLPNAVVLPASAVTQAEINQMKEDAAALKKQRAELQKQLKAIQADKSKALDQKALLEQQINATQAEINNIAAQITQYDQLIAQKETELAATEEKERPSTSCSASGCGRWRSRGRSPTGPSCSAPTIFPTCWTTP